MRVFVTGGSGFIGGHLIDKLSSQGEVFNYDIKEGHDIEDRKNLQMAVSLFKPEVVYHLSAVLGTSETFIAPIHTASVNILGTLKLLESLKVLDLPPVLIYASKPLVWSNPYTITKACAEEFIRMYHDVYGLSAVICRLHNVYGPRQALGPVRKAIPNFIASALKDEPITVFGNGKQSFDWIYIDDAVDALILASQRNVIGESIDIGTGVAVSVNEVVDTIIEITGSESKVEHLPWRLGEDPGDHLVASTSKASRLMGFRARIGLREGLEKTIEYYEEIKYD